MVQHRGDALPECGAVSTLQHGERLGDDTGDGLARIERAVRVLEHHLEIAPRAAQLVGRDAVEVAPKQRDLPRGRPLQRHHDARERGFSGAGLADDAEALAGLDLYADAVERPHLARWTEQAFARQRIALLEILHVEKR